MAHLTASGQIGSPVTLGWIRRTRIDGDPWTESEVPLGEDRERYLVRVKQGTAVLREVEVTSPGWTYTSGDQSADGAVSPVTISVAQLSDRVGAGPFVSVSV